jgi:hypothetical protein
LNNYSNESEDNNEHGELYHWSEAVSGSIAITIFLVPPRNGNWHLIGRGVVKLVFDVDCGQLIAFS